MAALRPRVREIADGLLDAMAAGGGEDPVDLIDAYAVPLPLAVICELLGVPASDRAEFGAWSNASIDDTDQAVFLDATAAMARYIGGLLAAKAASPDDGLLTAFLAASEEDDRLSPEEVVSMGILLLVAGYETSSHLIGNSVLRVLTDPDLRRRAEDPEVLPTLVDELLRSDGPVHNALERFAAVDVEYSGVTIPAGSSVTLSLGSANRDPSRFQRPDVVDVERAPERGVGQLAFGHGIHHCLGAGLARAEGEIALGALLDRFPRLSLAVAPDVLERRPSTLVHGLLALPVRTGVGR